MKLFLAALLTFSLSSAPALATTTAGGAAPLTAPLGPCPPC